MKTLFDVGDEIEVVLRGRVHEYEVSTHGDCYTIILDDPALKNNSDKTRVYLDSDSLRNARKIEG